MVWADTFHSMWAKNSFNFDNHRSTLQISFVALKHEINTFSSLNQFFCI